MIRSERKSRKSGRQKESRLSVRPRLEHLEDRVTPSVNVGNLAVASELAAIDGNLLAVAVSESDQGSTDLNGDGDTDDAVLHLYDNSTKVTTNFGLDASGGLQLQGNLLAFSVSELNQDGLDLNADGDISDTVLHVYNVSTGVTTNLGLDSFHNFRVGDSVVAFGVNEFRQRSRDLNGDGDTSDRSVLHVYDVTSGSITNLEHEAFDNYSLNDDFLVFRVSEAAQGATDLNGDGDISDSVLHVFDLNSSTTTNLELDTFGFQSSTNLLAFNVIESRQGDTDLNGDGDAFDSVLHLFDASAGTTTSLGLDTSQFALDGNRLAFSVSEFGQGSVDINGDGDSRDIIVHTFDPLTGVATNLGVSTFGALQLEGDFLTFGAHEFSNGKDLNGDGDTSESVQHVFNYATGTTTNLGVNNVGGVQLHGQLLAISVAESFEGFTDLNGDGDASDRVMHVYDVSSNTLTNLGVDASFAPAFADFPALSVREEHQGSTDLNGDGDASDLILHFHDATTGTVTNLELDGSNFLGVGDEFLATFVLENGTAGMDFNGDGDLSDEVLRVVDLSVPLSDAPRIESADVGADLKSIIIQLNDTNLQALATKPANYQLLIANGDANGDGDFFNDGDEKYVAISGATFDAATDRITLQLKEEVFADVYRLLIDGDDRATDGTPGLANQNGLYLRGGDFLVDFDLRVLTLVEQLLDKVESLGLSTGAENSLTSRLTAASQVLGADVDEDDGLTRILEAFRLGVEGWFDRGEITVAERDDLLADVDLILLGLALTDDNN